MRELYRKGVGISAVIAIIIGFVLLFKTASDGGGTVGYVIGALFVAYGGGRLYLLSKT